MQVRIDQFKNGGVPCGCGRSPTGFCNGWHGLSEERYQQELAAIQEEQELKDEFDEDDANEVIMEIDDFLRELGTQIGVSDDDEDYGADCSHCGWEGNTIDVVFKDGEFYCPSCGTMFVPPKDDDIDDEHNISDQGG